jgi:hypothetical protein
MRVVPLAAPLLLGACTLLVSTDDLSGGTVDGGVTETGVPESDTGSDAPSEANAPDARPPSSYRDLVLSDMPRVYWRMGISNGVTVPDETGGGNVLTLQGSGFGLGQDGAIAGDPDTSISFDGDKSYATALDPRVFDYLDHHPFTIELWARHDSRGGATYQHLLGDLDNPTGDPKTRNGYYLYANQLGGAVNFSLEWDTPGAPQGISSSAKVNDNTWAHVCGVFDGQNVRVYVNAAPGAPFLVGMAGITARASPLIVGAEDPSGNAFSGRVDEIAIYDTALSPETIAKHAAAGTK